MLTHRGGLPNNHIEKLNLVPNLNIVRIGSSGFLNSCFYYSLLRAISPQFTPSNKTPQELEQHQAQMIISFRRDIANWITSPSESKENLNEYILNVKSIILSKCLCPYNLKMITLRDTYNKYSTNRIYTDTNYDDGPRNVLLKDIPLSVALIDDLIEPQTREETYIRLSEDFIFETPEIQLNTKRQIKGVPNAFELATALHRMNPQQIKQIIVSNNYPNTEYSHISSYYGRNDILTNWSFEKIKNGDNSLELKINIDEKNNLISLNLGQAVERLYQLRKRILSACEQVTKTNYEIMTENDVKQDPTPDEIREIKEGQKMAVRCAGAYLYRIDKETTIRNENGLPLVDTLLLKSGFFERSGDGSAIVLIAGRSTLMGPKKGVESELSIQQRIDYNYKNLWLRHIGNLIRRYIIERRTLISAFSSFCGVCNPEAFEYGKYLNEDIDNITDSKEGWNLIATSINKETKEPFTPQQVEALKETDPRTLLTPYMSPEDLQLPLNINFFMVNHGQFIRNYSYMMMDERGNYSNIQTLIHKISPESGMDASESDIIAMAPAFTGVNICICEVFTNKIGIYRIYPIIPEDERKIQNDGTPWIVINHAGRHFETMGIFEGDSVKTVFEYTHPFITYLLSLLC